MTSKSTCSYIDKTPVLSQKYIDDMHLAIDESIKEMHRLTENSIVSAVSEELAISRLATEAIQGVRKIIETEALSLIDTMSVSYSEAHCVLAKLRGTNEAVSKEAAFIVSSLSPIKRMTTEVSDYCVQLERLNAAIEMLSKHIESGVFDIAAKISNSASMK